MSPAGLGTKPAPLASVCFYLARFGFDFGIMPFPVFVYGFGLEVGFAFFFLQLMSALTSACSYCLDSAFGFRAISLASPTGHRLSVAVYYCGNH